MGSTLPYVGTALCRNTLLSSAGVEGLSPPVLPIGLVEDGWLGFIDMFYAPSANHDQLFLLYVRKYSDISPILVLEFYLNLDQVF